MRHNAGAFLGGWVAWVIAWVADLVRSAQASLARLRPTDHDTPRSFSLNTVEGPLATQLAAWVSSSHVRRSAGRRRRGDEAAGARRHRPGAGRIGNRLRSLDARRRGGVVAAWPVADSRYRREGGRVRRRVCERGVRSGARVRRHPQRVDRAHEQPGGGRGARAVRDAAASPAATRSSPLRWPTRSRRAWAVVAPGQFHRRGFHPTGLFAPFGITYLAGKLLGQRRGDDGARRRHLRQLSPPACSSAGSTARSRSSCIRVSPRRAASPPRRWRTRA